MIRSSRLQQLVEHAADALALRCVAIDEVLQHAEAVAIGQHQAIRSVTVAPCPTDFLTVIFHRLGQVVVHHVADVRFVDAHTKGNGGDDAVQLAGHEAALDRLTQLMGHAGVVGAAWKASLRQMLGDLLGGLLLGDVDDGRLTTLVGQPFHQPALLVKAADRLHQQIEVGPVEAGSHDVVRRNREFGLHVGNHRRCRRGGQQQHLRDIELTLVVGKLEVIWAEVVPPLGNAMRLIDDQQRDRHLADEVTETLVLQSLHRNHQDLQFTGLGAGHGFAGLLAALRRIDACRRYVVSMQES